MNWVLAHFQKIAQGETRSSSAQSFTAGFQTTLSPWFCWPLCMLSRFLVKHSVVLNLVIIGESEGDWVTRLREFRAVVGLWGGQEAHPLPAPAGKC